MNEIECSRCGEICVVDGDFPRYFAWCETCKDYAGGFDDHAYAQEVMASIANSRPEEGSGRANPASPRYWRRVQERSGMMSGPSNAEIFLRRIDELTEQLAQAVERAEKAEAQVERLRGRYDHMVQLSKQEWALIEHRLNEAERLREVVDLCAIWFEVDDEERKSMGGDDRMREALAASDPAQEGEKAKGSSP